MDLLSEIMDANAAFVARREYERYGTDRFPDKKLVVLSCMDTRLVELLPRALNLRQGDAKIITNAGAIVSHPFGSIMRSILVAVYELGAEEVAVIGHHGCGMTGLSAPRLLDRAAERGIPGQVISTLEHAGIDMASWLTGFDSPAAGVRESVNLVKNHPLLPPGIAVHGLLIDPTTGALELLIDGYGAAGRATQPVLAFA